MLSFDLRNLGHQALHVDGELGADDSVWTEEDIRPASPVRVTGRLSPAGGTRYYFAGRMEGSATADCRRCLTPVTSAVAEDVHIIFAESGDETADDPDVYLLDPRASELDLRPAIREQWLLGVPHFPLCREDCKGFCPTCGADLNVGPCACPPQTDDRWAALREQRDA